MVGIPSPELLEEMREIYSIDFVPRPFVSKEDFEQALRRQGQLPGIWSDEQWEEYERYDSILAADTAGAVHRFIRTITIIVARYHKLRHDVVVREYLYGSIELPDGSVTVRRYGGKLSEKIRWREKSGRWVRRATQWRKLVRRTIYEELRVALMAFYLTPPWLCKITPALWYSRDEEVGPVVVKDDDPTRPGITTHNELQHAFLRLPKRYWKKEYRERKYRDGVLVKTILHRWRREAPAQLP